MPFCPVCEDEFRPGFTWCRRCDAQLVPELPDRTSPESEPDEAEPESEPDEAEPDVADEISFRSDAEDFSVQVYVGVPGAKFDLVRSLLHGAAYGCTYRQSGRIGGS